MGGSFGDSPTCQNFSVFQGVTRKLKRNDKCNEQHTLIQLLAGLNQPLINKDLLINRNSITTGTCLVNQPSFSFGRHLAARTLSNLACREWRNPMHRLILLLVASLLLVGSANVALAQAGSASIRGIVTDPQGSPVAGATVTIAAPERNFTRTQTTNSDGGYLFKPVPPGTYRLEIEMKGFKKALLAAVHALVDTPKDVG